MVADSYATVNALRDVIQRRRCGLPIPETVDLDELLEEAADVIEALEDQLDSDDDY